MLVGSKENAGDSSHRTCMYIIGWLFSKYGPLIIDPYTSIRTMFNKGDPIRHPSKGWWSDKDRFSRDQQSALVIAMAVYGYTNMLLELLLRHLARFGFFTNTRRNGATKENHGKLKYSDSDERYNYDYKIADFITPEFTALYIRGLNWWLLYPLLWVLDIQTLADSIILRLKPKQDILNHVLICEYTSRKWPTLWTWLANKCNDNFELKNGLYQYFKRVGMPEMYLMWSKIIYNDRRI